MRKGIVGIVALLAVVAGGLGLAIVDSTSDPEVVGAEPLQVYDDCDALLGAIQAQAIDAVGPYGLDDVGGFIDTAAGAETVEDAVASSGAEGDAEAPVPTTIAPQTAGEELATDDATATSDGNDFSTTNVQEVGVDEADVVKSDGERLVAVSGTQLHTFDVSGDEPALLGSVELLAGIEGGGSSDHSAGFELLVTGDRALVLGRTYDDVLTPMPLEGGVGAEELSTLPAGQETTVLLEVDLSEASDPTVAASAVLEGGYTTARMVGDVARIVTSTYAPDLGFVYPSDGGSNAGEVAEQTNRELVERSTLDDWLPLVSVDGGEPQPAVACDQVGLPGDPSGFGTATVVTVDLADGLSIEPESAASVIGGSEAVYASTENLYVATTRYPDPELLQELERIPGIEDVATFEDLEELDAEVDGRPVAEVVREEVLPATAVHRFALPADGPATYEASGVVPGRMLSQFSFSEHAGHLRVATTVDDPAGTSGQLTVLAVDDLHEVGSATDIGPPGEELYAVRMIGDVGYVVTFEQTDPLFTLDLADPASPRVVGELEIPGYSAYLHPVSDRLLLGIGQDGTEDGVLTGTQVSLFDVSDPASPQRIQQWSVDGGSSQAEYDHRAFLWWADTNLAAIPLSVYRYDGTGQLPFDGLVGLHVTEAAIDEVGTVSHADPNVDCEAIGIVGDAEDEGEGGGEADDAPPLGEVDADDGVSDGDDLVEEPSEPATTTSTTVAVEPATSVAPDEEVPGCAAEPILRSLVVGDSLYTLSSHLLQQNDLTTLEPRAQVPFG